MWAAENYAPGLIAISESAGENPLQSQRPKWRRLCRYLGVLAFLSVLGIGLCFAIALTVAQPPGHASWEYLLISSPIVIPGLLALYLCTRRCCGLILNLVFAFLALLCGAVLVATETLASIGIMLTIVGGAAGGKRARHVTMWAAENYAPGLIAISESAGENPLQSQRPKWRRLCRYLGVLAFLSVLGIGLCFAIALTVAQPPGHASWEYLLISSPIVIPGLLALYLCTRRCCGLILNLVFAFLALLCGAVLVATETLASIGIMLTIVGGLILVVILVTLVYDRVTGRSYDDDDDYEDGELGVGVASRAAYATAAFGAAQVTCSSGTTSPRGRTPTAHRCGVASGSPRKRRSSHPPTQVQFIVPELPPPSSGLHSRNSPEHGVHTHGSSTAAAGGECPATPDGMPRGHHEASVASTSGRPGGACETAHVCPHAPSPQPQLAANGEQHSS
nr:uncharacterized protein LOC119169237 [Rhipicephalus microplus]